jgi:hypothetical protein
VVVDHTDILKPSRAGLGNTAVVLDPLADAAEVMLNLAHSVGTSSGCIRSIVFGNGGSARARGALGMTL